MKVATEEELNFVNDDNKVKDYPTSLRLIILVYSFFLLLSSIYLACYSPTADFGFVFLVIPLFGVFSFLMGLTSIIILIRKNREMSTFQRRSSLLIFIAILTCIIPWYLIFGLSRLFNFCFGFIG